MVVDLPEQLDRHVDEYERAVWLKFCVMWSMVGIMMQIDRAIYTGLGEAYTYYFNEIAQHTFVRGPVSDDEESFNG